MSKRILIPLVTLLLGATFAAPAGAARYVVVLDEGVDPDAVAAYHEGFAGVTVVHRYRHALNGYAAEVTPTALAALRADSRVAFVSADRVFRTTAQTLPTGINRIDGELSSALSGNGSGSVNVNVAVIDTGIDPSHPDLNVVGGKDCAPGVGFNDFNGHGSHVAGTIAAKDDGNGVVGVAPGANLYAVKVLNDAGVGLTTDIICGIDWVTSTRTDLNPANNIAVANMSIGGGGTDDNNCGNSNNDAYHRSICNSTAAGVTHVAAAGNDGVDFRHGGQLQQLGRARRRPEPHDCRAGRLHQLDVHARRVQHDLGNEHGLTACRRRGRALHRDWGVHRDPGADHLEAPDGRPELHDREPWLRIHEPGRPLLRLPDARVVLDGFGEAPLRRGLALSSSRRHRRASSGRPSPTRRRAESARQRRARGCRGGTRAQWPRRSPPCS
jgi:Subtilase family/Peptidase inhibitor I9